jgi:catechol 2,3-dioxygenase
MKPFRLPAATQIGYVHLQVSSLDKALGFYRDLLGFQEMRQETGRTVLSASGGKPYHLLLDERPGARPKPPRTTGLYHVAIRFPSRRALARVFRRLATHEWPLQGAADHRVSEAIYLADPDGIGLELYVDRPRERWSWERSQVAMATDPLDVADLLKAAKEGEEPWAGIDPGTDIGHVHLHVSDLGRAEAFYSGLLGLDVTQRSYPGALFLSAGGYHHHVGLNTWAGVGAPSPPPDSVGLRSFALRLPDGEAWRTLLARVREADVRVADGQDDEYVSSVLIRDPDGIGVELAMEKGQGET